MKDLNIIEAYGYTSPNSLMMACTLKEDGSTNLAPVCFMTILSFKPPMIGFMFGGKNLTTERLQTTGKIILATPGKSLSEQVMACAKCHGHDHDKAKEFGIELKEVVGSEIRIPVDSKLVLQCSFVKSLETGDHLFHICNIDKISGDDTVVGLHAWDGFGKVAPAQMGQC